MKLLAISDLHVAYADNRRALERTPRHPDDWLILGGDVCETSQQLDQALAALQDRFARLIWVPGNHELWTRPLSSGARGAQKYAELVEVCRRRGVVTPEDPYPLWEGPGGPHIVAPLFLLYDYSFAPDEVPAGAAVAWAAQAGILCSDEYLLHPDPFPSRAAWCAARVASTERRLEAAVAAWPHPTVLINHFPLRRELAMLPRIPRFSIWCGTSRSEDWHVRYRANSVVYGHLHRRGTHWIDGVRFEEVSLGYPGQWQPEGRGLEPWLREILPARPVP
jgi:3',5'-cyclic AMP phosphodiesterase CpdA